MDGTELDTLIKEHRLEPLIEPLATLVQSSLTAEIVIKLAMAYGIHMANTLRAQKANDSAFMQIQDLIHGRGL